MALLELPIATGFYESQARALASQSCINWIPVVPQTNALSGAALIGTPGIDQIATLDGKNRGAHVMNGKAYFVNGTSLFRVNRDFTTDNLGVIDGTSRVSMADNGLQICIVVPSLKGFIFTEDPDTLTEITDSDFTANGQSKQVCFKDGFFVHTADKKFFISNLNDGLTYDALDFGTAEVDPDGIVGCHVSRNQLFIFGNETIEPFQNIGGADFPFQRIPGGVVPKGLKSAFTSIEFDNSFVFLGAGTNEKPAVWRYTGNSAQKISNSAIDTALQEYTDAELSSAFSMSYAQNGSYFVMFTLPRNCFVYDATASSLQGRPVWHERRSGLGDGERWRVNSMIEAYGEILVGDAFDGRIGKINDETFTEYGDVIIRTVTSSPFEAQTRQIFVSKIEVEIQAGVGNLALPGTDPIMRMSFSDDGSSTFSNEMERPMGAAGKFNTLLEWWAQGLVPRNRVLKFRMSDPVKPTLLKLTANVDFEEV